MMLFFLFSVLVSTVFCDTQVEEITHTFELTVLQDHYAEIEIDIERKDLEQVGVEYRQVWKDFWIYKAAGKSPRVHISNLKPWSKYELRVVKDPGNGILRKTISKTLRFTTLEKRRPSFFENLFETFLSWLPVIIIAIVMCLVAGFLIKILIL
ncbi:unnamed protein product [Caenorhabditis angaria]|uniref:Fibronectin type-III domain-containing protein n=1 Tax=Caenorhabditis angaria TaxID=860376 RepID=A0A9P1J3P3_9PELO|nr:unnamed protein product [Caenorhabditis angaria]